MKRTELQGKNDIRRISYFLEQKNEKTIDDNFDIIWIVWIFFHEKF